MLHSFNEWDTLKEVVVGDASFANWPTNDPVFAQEHVKTTWKHSPVPAGPVPQWIIDETNEDLENLVDILKQAGVVVHRPWTINYQKENGMYNYCPRDRVIVAGDTLVDVAMMYPCRDVEIHGLEFLLSHRYPCVTMPRAQGLVCDAANVCRLNDHWLFLESASGNRAAAEWLQTKFPKINIHVVNFYSGVHIDSTVVALREGLVALNGARVKTEQLPKFMQDWDIIWVNDVVEQGFYQYPYASKWIAMNMLSIDPHTVILDAAQVDLRKQLESKKITVIPATLRHSRTLGGGFHCVTLDLVRQS